MLFRRSRVRIEIEQHTLRVEYRPGSQTASPGSPAPPVSPQNPAGIQPSPSDQPDESATAHTVQPPQIT
jgi:hypothetical protein